MAELDSALGGKLGAPIAIPSGADLNNYKTPGLYYVGADSIVATIKNTPTKHSFVLLVEKLNDVGDCVQTLKAWSDGSAYRADTYIRSSYPEWRLGWQRLATALPPEEIPLQLAAGMLPTSKSVLSKNQFGEVHVHGTVSAGDGVIGWNQTIGTLPEGYRPSAQMEFGASFATDGVNCAGAVSISTDGVIRAYPDISTPHRVVYFDLFFYC